jgi:gamma-glutamyl-gamma-aminobutyrate hydrolase PuuD
MSEKRRPVVLLNMAVNIVGQKECDTLNSEYSRRVFEAGGLPVLMPSVENSELIEAWLDIADGVLLVGGKDYLPSEYGCEPHPETFLGRLRPHFDIAFAKALMRRNMPVLGICAGCQLLNIVTGGKLIQHLENADESHRGGKYHSAKICSDGFFAGAVGLDVGNELTVNSFHHQAVDPDHLGKGMKISAQAFDGTVEAIELDVSSRMVLGVQFHPERMEDLAPKFFGRLCSQADIFRTARQLRIIFVCCLAFTFLLSILPK